MPRWPRKPAKEEPSETSGTRSQPNEIPSTAAPSTPTSETQSPTSETASPSSENLPLPGQETLLPPSDLPLPLPSIPRDSSSPTIPLNLRLETILPTDRPGAETKSEPTETKPEVNLEAPLPPANPPEMPEAKVLEYVKPFPVHPPDRWIGYCIDTADANRAAQYADRLLTQEIACFDDRERGIYFHAHSYLYTCVHNEAARGRPRTARFVERAWGK